MLPPPCISFSLVKMYNDVDICLFTFDPYDDHAGPYDEQCSLVHLLCVVRAVIFLRVLLCCHAYWILTSSVL